MTVRDGTLYRIVYQHDILDRRTQARLDQGFGQQPTVKWTYSDTTSQVARIIGPGSDTTKFGYNADLLRQTVDFPTTPERVENISYTSQHASYSQLFSPGPGTLNLIIRQDSLGRTVQAFHGQLDSLVQYKYNRSGELIQALQLNPGSTSTCAPDVKYGQECTFASLDTIAERNWQYDRNGNPAGPDDLIGPGNRALRIRGEFGHVDTMSYDADGNMTRRAGVTYVQHMKWSPVGTLDTVYTWNRSGGGADTVLQNTAWYRYDGWGRRNWTVGHGDSSRHILDGEFTFAETFPTPILKRVNTYYPNSYFPHSMRMYGQPDSGFYYIADEGGSVEAILDHVGNVRMVRRAWPWGDPGMSGFSTVANPFGFEGQYNNPGTAFTYMRARYYIGGIRRFISEDPLGLAGGINPYVYAGNDPVNASDPTGLQPCRHIYRFETDDTGTVIASSIELLFKIGDCDEGGSHAGSPGKPQGRPANSVSEPKRSFGQCLGDAVGLGVAVGAAAVGSVVALGGRIIQTEGAKAVVEGTAYLNRFFGPGIGNSAWIEEGITMVTQGRQAAAFGAAALKVGAGIAAFGVGYSLGALGACALNPNFYY